MNNIAIENLKLINKLSNDDYLISEGKKLLIINKNDFESVIKFDSLEYPIYFTFNYLLNDITENAILTYKYKIQLLELINESINNLINYLDIYDEKNTIKCLTKEFDRRFNKLVNFIDYYLDNEPEKEITVRKLFFDKI